MEGLNKLTYLFPQQLGINTVTIHKIPRKPLKTILWENKLFKTLSANDKNDWAHFYKFRLVNLLRRVLVLWKVCRPLLREVDC
jgi:hypothetical protein